MRIEISNREKRSNFVVGGVYAFYGMMSAADLRLLTRDAGGGYSMVSLVTGEPKEVFDCPDDVRAALENGSYSYLPNAKLVVEVD